MIDRDTTVCISIAEKPGNLGATIFNTAFRELGLNYLYKPFLVRAEDLAKAIDGIRVFGIRGCGVSMPHKVAVMEYLDEIDAPAKTIGAVNTIVNQKGRLIGYNTDFEGARIITRDDYPVRGKQVFIAGAGGAARAIIQAVKENQAAEIALTNRDDEKAKRIAEAFNIKFVPWGERGLVRRGHLLVNATPVGMQAMDEPVFSDEIIAQFDAVLDVVVSAQDTSIIARAKALGKIALPGIRMSVIQGKAQFKLYTTPDLSEAVIERSITEFFKNN